MTKSSDTQQKDKFQTLLYILPTTDASLQKTVSSAITTAATAKNKTNSVVSKAIKLSTLFVFEAISPVSYPTFRDILSIVYSPSSSEEENDSKNEQKKKELNHLFNELNKEDWLGFISQVSYSSIPDYLNFSPGHPLPGKLYRSHPLKSKSNTYIPIEAFDSLLYAEREAELIRLLVDLGATKITIEDKKAVQTTAEATANLEMTGAGGVNNEVQAGINKLSKSTRSFTLGGNKWTPEIQKKFQANNYSWLDYEPSWSAVAHARLHGKCLTASIELTNDNSYSISGKIGLTEGLLSNLAVLDTGASFERNSTKISLISVEFAPPLKD